MEKLEIPPRDLSVRETAYLLAVSAPTIYKMIDRGALKSYHVGNSRRIVNESVVALRNGENAA